MIASLEFHHTTSVIPKTLVLVLVFGKRDHSKMVSWRQADFT